MRMSALRFVLFVLLWISLPVRAEKILTVGVLAFRDKAQTIQKWQPLVDYIDKALPGHSFALKVYTYEELEQAVERRQVDFVFTHGAHYVQISSMNSMSSPLATVIERESDRPIPVYGGSIIVKADREDLAHLSDLKGKTVATSSIQGFASYQMEAYELYKIGLNIPDDLNVIEVALPIDRSVAYVLEGKADAAFARMGLLEQLLKEGKLPPGQLKVLNGQKLAGFGYQFSTTLYPLWPFAAMPQVGDELAAKVAATLLMLPHDGEVARACNIWGFTIPADYQPIKDVMQALRMPPFDEVPKITWQDLWQRYRLAISLAVAAAVTILLLLIWLLLSRRLLREGEQRLISLVDSAPDAIVLANAKGTIVGWNKGAQRLFGYSASEVMLQPLTLLMPERHHVRHLAGMERIRSGGAPRLLGQLVELQGLRKDGSEFPFELLMGSWIASGGRHFSAIIRDITERKRISQELDAYQHHLIELVAERTAELEQAKNTAEAANRAKTIFLSNMSHELRTPLNAILGFTQIMESDIRIPQDQLSNISIINRSGNHLLRLINDVLEISRIEAGRTKVNNEVFDLAATLRSVVDMSRVRATAKGFALIVTLPDDMPSYVLGDVSHLRQVLLNLLGNAVKYTEKGEVRLSVRLLPDQMIRFEVADTGPGIPANEIEHIFKAFYQTEAGIAKGEGTGLGLTISREFVRLMGGELKVESIEGKGCRFYFTLPLPVMDKEPSGAIARNGRIVGLAPKQNAPLILLAEDRPDNQQMMEQLLKQIGCKVIIAGDGSEAVELFRSQRPQLILMDMRMPEMDGYQATRTIRSLSGGENIPILALTASAFEEDRSQVLAAGCSDMLSKPVEAQRLFDIIGRLLGLEYVYAPEDAPVDVATVDNLKKIPAVLRMELAEAAVILDNEAVMVIVDRLRIDYPAEADLLTELAKVFRFDTIKALCSD